MKHNTDNHYMIGHCWKGFQDQGSKVKVTERRSC